MTIKTAKLAKISLSPKNVRTSTELNLAPLAADIEARGVLQNLLVEPVAGKRGYFETFDGGRRWRALQLLVEQGKVDPDKYDVPIKEFVADPATLSETSLAANFHQLRLSPAEECRAFQHFLAKDGDIDGVAKRFGQTRKFIEGRLRLASLAEPIFDALAAGELTLDMAKAYASTESHEKQLAIFQTYRYSSHVSADSIRRVIADGGLKATDPVALLVGAQAYEAAGGRIDRDLFSDNGDNWLDAEIAQRLAGEKMEAEARRIGDETGLAWIRPIATAYTYNAAYGLHKVVVPAAPFTADEQVRLQEIEARFEAIEAEMEDEELSEDAFAELEGELEQLRGEYHSIASVRPKELPDDMKPHVGAFLTLTVRGEMKLDTEFYSEQPLHRGEDGTLRNGEQARSGGAADPAGGGGSGSSGASGASGAGDDGGEMAGVKPLSARLSDELAMQRRDVLAINLLDHPGLALDYLIFAIADGKFSYGELGSTIKAGRPQDPVVGELPSTRAREALAQAHDGLDKTWLGASRAVDRFEAFRALDDDAKAAWMAFAVASSLEAKIGYSSPAPCEIHRRLATIMEVDVAQWWRPTALNFFDRVSKNTCLAVLSQVGGPGLSGRYAASKKAELAKSCEALFAGETIVEAEVKERALAWVPSAMLLGDRQTEPEQDLEGAPAGSEEGADSTDLEDVSAEPGEAGHPPEPVVVGEDAIAAIDEVPAEAQAVADALQELAAA